MTRPARACIDLTALKHNLNHARLAAPGCRVMAIIKANAYGHGLLPVAQREFTNMSLSDVDMVHCTRQLPALDSPVSRLVQALDRRQCGAYLSRWLAVQPTTNGCGFGKIRHQQR